jgi:hypothetical protein
MMTTEERIDKMLDAFKSMQENPNFRLHKFDIYEHPELKGVKIIHEEYTTKRGGVYETDSNWYIISNGESQLLQDVIVDKTSLLEFKSGLTKFNYALGGVIFN